MNGSFSVAELCTWSRLMVHSFQLNRYNLTTPPLLLVSPGKIQAVDINTVVGSKRRSLDRWVVLWPYTVSQVAAPLMAMFARWTLLCLHTCFVTTHHCELSYWLDAHLAVHEVRKCNFCSTGCLGFTESRLGLDVCRRKPARELHSCNLSPQY